MIYTLRSVAYISNDIGAIVYCVYMQLLKEAKMAELEGDLDTHFRQEVLACAARFQSACQTENQPDPILSVVNTPENFGEELLGCIQGLPAPQVSTQRYNKIDVTN